MKTISTEDEQRLCKLNIVENMLQAARLETLGYYLEDGHKVLVGFNDRDSYMERFRKNAQEEAMNLLREITSNIDAGI